MRERKPLLRPRYTRDDCPHTIADNLLKSLERAKARKPIRERTRELQRDLGWPDDPRLPA